MGLESPPSSPPRSPTTRPVTSPSLDVHWDPAHGTLQKGQALKEIGQGFYSSEQVIGALRRFWALETQRIIRGTALVRHLRKRINAQRLGLSTCKAGALPTELRPRVLMSINMFHKTRKNTCVTLILSLGIAQR